MPEDEKVIATYQPYDKKRYIVYSQSRYINDGWDEAGRYRFRWHAKLAAWDRARMLDRETKVVDNGA